MLDMPSNRVYYLACQASTKTKGVHVSTQAVRVVHFFPGGTAEQYEASIAAVHPGNRPVAGGPALSRCRRVSRWLDDHGRA